MKGLEKRRYVTLASIVDDLHLHMPEHSFICAMFFQVPAVGNAQTLVTDASLTGIHSHWSSSWQLLETKSRTWKFQVHN